MSENYRANRPMRAVVVHGGAYWSNRARRLVHVPAGYVAARCEACQWEVLRPVRLGDADRLARKHVMTAHYGDLLSGKVTLGEPPAEWADRARRTYRHLAARSFG